MTDPPQLRTGAHPRFRLGEFLFAVVMVFVLTQGPVYTWWTRNAVAWDPFTDNAILASFMTVYVIAALVLTRRQLLTAVRSPAAVLLGGFVFWLMLSTLWSVTPGLTFSNSVGLLGVLVCALWFASRFTFVEQAAAVFAATSIGVVLSVWANLRDWSGTLDESFRWTGIYLNRNSLAPVAAVGAMAGTILTAHLVSLIVRRAGHRDGRLMLAVALTVGLSTLDVVALERSGSRTSLFGLAAAAAAGATAILVRRHHGSVRRKATLFVVSLAATAAVLGAIAIAITRRGGRDLGFSGRGKIWDLAWNGFLDRPVGGWGFLAAWRDPVFREPMRADWVLDTTIFEAHSGYLEVLLGGGVVPLLLLAAALFIGARHVVMNVFSSPNQAAVWPLALIAFTLTANLQESFLVGHHFLLLLLFVGLLSGIHHGQGGRE